MKKKNKECVCHFHIERKFLLTLKRKLTDTQYELLERIFAHMWETEDDLAIAEAKLKEIWPGYKIRKALMDMYNLKWFDNLTYIELLEKAKKLPL